MGYCKYCGNSINKPAQTIANPVSQTDYSAAINNKRMRNSFVFSVVLMVIFVLRLFSSLLALGQLKELNNTGIDRIQEFHDFLRVISFVELFLHIVLVIIILFAVCFSAKLRNWVPDIATHKKYAKRILVSAIMLFVMMLAYLIFEIYLSTEVFGFVDDMVNIHDLDASDFISDKIKTVFSLLYCIAFTIVSLVMAILSFCYLRNLNMQQNSEEQA